jgi:NAD(P)-dependent dehydrogenase (short-subunit alcohol dehydrogenase family)
MAISFRRSLMWTAGGIGALVALRAAVQSMSSCRFRGKTALVTGGSRGLGLLIARELAWQGAQVAICARDQEELRRAAAQSRAKGCELTTIACDLTQQREVEQMVDSLSRRWGQINVLVNNAGIIQVGPVEAMTVAEYQDAMNVHFWGPLYAINAVLPQMQARGGRTHRQRLVDRREVQRAPSASLLRQQVCLKLVDTASGGATRRYSSLTRLSYSNSAKFSRRPEPTEHPRLKLDNPLRGTA